MLISNAKSCGLVAAKLPTQQDAICLSVNAFYTKVYTVVKSSKCVLCIVGLQHYHNTN